MYTFLCGIRFCALDRSKTVLSFLSASLRSLYVKRWKADNLGCGALFLFGWNMHGQIYRIPSGKLTQLWKITIFNGKIHYKWPFSIAIYRIPHRKWTFAPLCDPMRCQSFRMSLVRASWRQGGGTWGWRKKKLWVFGGENCGFLGTFWKSMWFDDLIFIEIQLMFDRSKRANTSSYSRMNFFVSLISLRYCVSVSLSPMELQIRLDPKVWSPNWTGIEAVLQ